MIDSIEVCSLSFYGLNSAFWWKHRLIFVENDRSNALGEESKMEENKWYNLVLKDPMIRSEEDETNLEQRIFHDIAKQVKT